MSLPSPNLDDRTFQDIIAEAKKLIPGLCPDWTDFNPGDPGITLLELMAWMTEMILYRLNRVPDKNYIKFLELIGTTLLPPQPARVWLVFTPSEGVEEEDLPTVPPNSKVSSNEPSEEPVSFETCEPLNLTAVKPVKIYSRFKDRFTDHTARLLPGGSPEGIPIFQGEKEIPHILYLGDPDIGQVSEDAFIRLYITLEEPIPGLKLEWSCWNGKQWVVIGPTVDGTSRMSKSGIIIFSRLPSMAEGEISGSISYWIRLRLMDYRGEPLPRIRELKKTVESRKTKGIVPDSAHVSTEQIPYLPVDFYKIVSLFGKEAKEDDAFYFSSHIFSKPGTPVTVNIELADSYQPSPFAAVKDLEINWEYYSESGEWKLLGTAAAAGVSISKFDFTDKTEAFTHSGTVRFYVPDDIFLLELQKEEGYWLRVRIARGNYGTGKAANPPFVKSFLIEHKEKPTAFQYYIAYNDFAYKDLTAEIIAEKTFTPFELLPHETPGFYIGFNAAFSNKLHRIYFRLPETSAASSPSAFTWEYYTSGGWKTLKLVKDTTANLSERGAVEFVGPADWAICQEFAFWAFWLRARRESFENKDLADPPRLLGIHLNAVEAIHANSIKNEILGSGDGEPFQHFQFSVFPILPDPKIWVRELESAFEEEIGKFRETVKEKIIQVKDPETGKVTLWVEWRQIENFFYSKPESRHYMLDPLKGVLTFGDGISGKIPPIGTDNILCRIYYQGGGREGNVGKNTLTQLEAAIPHVDSVRNPEPAGGGADMETIEEAKLRAPWIVKHRYRAVTKEDFEKLAREAAGEVARALCRSDNEGIVKIIIVPYGKNDKLEPSPMLCEKVADYLDQRRLVTTRLEVLGPGYRDVAIQATIVLLHQVLDQFQEIKKKIEQSLRQFFHPLTGGLYEQGWPMGRSVHLSEIYYLIENTPGVDYVEKLTLDQTRGKEKIPIPADTFPYLKEIDIKLSGG